MAGHTEADSKRAARRRELGKWAEKNREEQRRKKWAIENCRPGSWHFDRTFDDLVRLQGDLEIVLKVMALAKTGTFSGCAALDDLAQAVDGNYCRIVDAVRQFLDPAKKLLDEKVPSPHDPAPSKKTRGGLCIIDGGVS